MTRLEALQAVLDDSTRSSDDREIAIRGLRRLAEHGEYDERLEAQKILATLPLTQDDEDKKILIALDFKHPQGPYRPSLAPEYKYPKPLQDLVLFIRCDPDLCGAFARCAHRTVAEYASDAVKQLTALHARTSSERIRAAVAQMLADIARTPANFLDAPDAKQDAARFLSSLPTSSKDTLCTTDQTEGKN